MLRDDKEQVAKMKRFRMIGVALLAVFALGAVVASAAQAEGYWTIQGSRLAAGKTHNFTAKAVTNFALVTAEAGATITCTAFKLKEGVLLGSNPGAAGTSNEVVVFEKCSLVEGNGAPACKLKSETLTTNSLKNELVESETGTLLTLFTPASGTVFITLEFEGTCTTNPTKVTGSVLGEDTTDPTVAGGSEEIIKLGSLKEETSWNLRFPNPALTKYVNAKGEKITIKGLTAFGDASTQTGTALTLLANSKGETESINWSPLP
jgi:hypothetical protein